MIGQVSTALPAFFTTRPSSPAIQKQECTLYLLTIIGAVSFPHTPGIETRDCLLIHSATACCSHLGPLNPTTTAWVAMTSLTRAAASSSARLVGRSRLLCTADYHASARIPVTSSPVATTSRVTLTTTVSCQSANSFSRRTFMTRSAERRQSPRSLKTALLQPHRGMATLTRQPESPEEPEVFSGSEPPSIILTDRAVQVRAFGKRLVIDLD